MRKFHESSIGESDEWYTPPEIFAALRLAFDLDPCHPGLGTPNCAVPASHQFTAADDGLSLQWRGLVFMNPPFGGRNAHVPWLAKFHAHGNGIAIVRAYTSSAWFQKWVPAFDAALFPRGKTKFIRPDGSVGKAPGHGVVLLAAGVVAEQALRAANMGWCP